MGNVCAIDMGIVILRVSIFDKSNNIFPYKIQKKLNQNASESSDKNKDPYFMSDLSFYSKEHGGTFHFLQFNVLYKEEFLKSLEFTHFLKFINKTYPQLQESNSQEHWGNFVKGLQFRKSFMELDESSKFNKKIMEQDMHQLPLLSTGGYNDVFLKFLANSFNTRIVKCREWMKFVLTAIDYLNMWTNDCFFNLDRPSQNVLNFTGKLKAGQTPVQQFFSLKKDLYPYLLVNLRSGSTFTRVDSKTEHRRITGSPIGANFFLGILRILNEFNDPSEAINGAMEGDSSEIDMSVGHIYGGTYEKLGLDARMLASSFGRVQHLDEPSSSIQKNDVARSLLTMVCVNTLILSKQIAHLEKIKNVVWIGSHIDMLEYMQMSADTFGLLVHHEAKLIFPTYHSFLGSLGLLLNHEKLSENNCNSSDQDSDEDEKKSSGVSDTKFEEVKNWKEEDRQFSGVGNFHSNSTIYPDYIDDQKKERVQNEKKMDELLIEDKDFKKLIQ